MSYGKFKLPLKALKAFKGLKDIFKEILKENIKIYFFKENQIFQSGF